MTSSYSNRTRTPGDYHQGWMKKTQSPTASVDSLVPCHSRWETKSSRDAAAQASHHASRTPMVQGLQQSVAMLTKQLNTPTTSSQEVQRMTEALVVSSSVKVDSRAVTIQSHFLMSDLGKLSVCCSQDMTWCKGKVIKQFLANCLGSFNILTWLLNICSYIMGTNIIPILAITGTFFTFYLRGTSRSEFPGRNFRNWDSQEEILSPNFQGWNFNSVTHFLLIQKNKKKSLNIQFFHVISKLKFKKVIRHILLCVDRKAK